jgi:hypothetical protein
MTIKKQSPAIRRGKFVELIPLALKDRAETMSLTSSPHVPGFHTGDLASVQFVTSSDLKEAKITKGRTGGRRENRKWRLVSGEPEHTFFWFKRGKGAVIVQMLMERQPRTVNQRLNLFYTLHLLVNQMLDDTNDKMPAGMRRGRRLRLNVDETLAEKVAAKYIKLRIEKRKAKAQDPKSTPNIHVGWKQLRQGMCPNKSDEEWEAIYSRARNLVREFSDKERRVAKAKFAKSATI